MGKALGEMTDGERTDAQARRDGAQRLEHEAAVSKFRMGNCQPPRAELPAAPEYQVEIEYPRTPAAAPAAAELALQCLEAMKQPRRVEISFDERNRVREIAAGAADGRVEDDR